MRFSVWAPLAGAVELVLEGARQTMARAPQGWWVTEVPGAGPGTDYGFSVDGGEPRPDPRSPSQPHGVHGPSQVVDHGAFAWSDSGWRGFHLPSAVLYELHVGTFSPEGTFDGVIGRLDHLVDLGVDALELMPVAQFPGERGWGYDGVDLFAPHSAYGGPDGLKRLVDACHRRNLGVVLDVVYNHLGPDGNYLSTFGPYFTDRYATPWGAAVNFDEEWSGGARGLVADNACSWLRDYHLDGLRLDAVHAIFDRSAVHLLEELASAVDELAGHLGRPLHLIAESDLNDPRVVRSREVGGYGLAASWSDEFHHALHAVLTGETDGYYRDFGSLNLLAKALRQSYVYDGTWSEHRKRVHGRPPTALSGGQLLAYLQNHDQVGNRAAGERSSALMAPGRLKAGAALVLTSAFVPMLFQGEEWAASSPFQYFTDHGDPELGRAVSEGRRAEFSTFGWKPEDVPDPQDPATFARSKLDWEERARPPHSELLDWHRQLIRLRRALPALADGRMDRVETVVGEAQDTLITRRGPVSVAVNLGGGPATLAATGEVAMASDGAVTSDGESVRLPPDAVAVVVAGGAPAGA